MLKEKLMEALAAKENDITTFVWREKKSKNGQNEVKMIDCSIEELKGFYDHCMSMLYNTDKEKVGRYILLDNIKDLRDRCNVELFLRWLKDEKNTTRFVFLMSLNECLENNPHIDIRTAPVSVLLTGCPEEFGKLSISLVLDGCMDQLGVFNKKIIKNTFLWDLGIWLSSEENKKMKKEGYKDKIQYITTQISSKVSGTLLNSIKISPKGLSLSQMQSMLSLKNKKKYSEMDSVQLETLRNKVSFCLESDVKNQAKQWEKRINQIKMVLESKGVKI